MAVLAAGASSAGIRSSILGSMVGGQLESMVGPNNISGRRPIRAVNGGGNNIGGRPLGKSVYTSMQDMQADNNPLNFN